MINFVIIQGIEDFLKKKLMISRRGDKADQELVKFKEFCDKHAFVIYEKAKIKQPMEEFRLVNFWASVPPMMTDFSIKTVLGTTVSIVGKIGDRTTILENTE